VIAIGLIFRALRPVEQLVRWKRTTDRGDIKNFSLHDFWFIMVRAFQSAGQIVQDI